MTDREIRLELAKVALANGTNIETTEVFYKWVSAAPELEVVDKRTQWDNTPIEELARKTNRPISVMKRCIENGIETVGDLIRCGGRRFLSFNKVGRGTVSQIDDALTYFGVNDWYAK